MYIKKSCKIGKKIEIEKHYPARYGAPGCQREKRRRRTPEEVAKQNHWRRCRDLRRQIELNFRGGDWHATLTCKKELRPSKEEAREVIRKFITALRKEYKKRGWTLKYIYSMEIGERGAVHWHMIINNMHSEEMTTAALIKKHWLRGRPYFSPLDQEGDYKQLADYMVKEAKKRIDDGSSTEKLSYTPSRNLIKPTIKEEKIRASTWRKEPKAPEGYYVIPDSIYNGINPFTGWPYQYYTIAKSPPDSVNTKQRGYQTNKGKTDKGGKK